MSQSGDTVGGAPAAGGGETTGDFGGGPGEGSGGDVGV